MRNTETGGPASPLAVYSKADTVPYTSLPGTTSSEIGATLNIHIAKNITLPAFTLAHHSRTHYSIFRRSLGLACAQKVPCMIELGLSRILRLLRNVPIKWKACHVAGTNGKGSVCAFTSAMLHASGVKCGRFTSPHLIDRWDCITLDERPVSASLFKRVEGHVKRDNLSNDIGASEFEILTATAFSIFHETQIDVGVIEVGLGGSQDATNVLQSPIVTILTKIGYDHQAILGNSIEDITSHKAGIMKPGVPCLVDGTNEAHVCDILRLSSQRRQAASLQFVPQDTSDSSCHLEQAIAHLNLAPHQINNAQLGLEATQIILRDLGKKVPLQQIIDAIEGTHWPGRLQFLRSKIDPLVQHKILLDGAHNAQAARSLGKFVNERLRGTGLPIVWVIAMSRGRAPGQVLREILQSGDSLVATTFGPVDGMPWVAALEPREIVDAARTVCSLSEALIAPNGAVASLRDAFQMFGGSLFVATGSLYLVSDILRFERQSP